MFGLSRNNRFLDCEEANLALYFSPGPGEFRFFGTFTSALEFILINIELFRNSHCVNLELGICKKYSVRI